MAELILFILASIGMTHVLVDGSIFSWLRNLAFKYLPRKISAIFTCYQCAGMWCGFLLGYFIIDKDPFKVLACGCASSFLSMIAATYLNYLEAQTIISLDKE